MWFKMDIDLLTHSRPFVRCLETRFRTDSNACLKAFVLAQLLAESANEQYWRDANEMSRMLRRPKKSCEQVWQICIEEGVLRPFNDGYNALEWMREKGLIGDTRQQNQSNGYETNRDHLAATTKNIF